MEKIPLPSSIAVLTEEGNEATFEIYPYFPGYGPTIGNALRRVLLSSLPGAALTAVRVEGMAHEFSTLPGVAEDVVSLLLNLKRVRLRMEVPGPVELRLQAKGVGVARASDITPVTGVTIGNPEQVIAHLTAANASFDFILTAERGRGYVPVEEREQEERPIGTIAIDALYTPVERVSFRVENVRVRQETEYHKLILTIRTDGTIAPRTALSQAASILQDHYAALVGDVAERLTFRPAPAESAPGTVLTPTPTTVAVAPEETLPPPTEERLVSAPVAGAVRAPEEKRDLRRASLAELPVATRVRNLLEQAGLRVVGELTSKSRTDLLALPGIGEKTLVEIEAALTKLGFSFRDTPPLGGV